MTQSFVQITFAKEEDVTVASQSKSDVANGKIDEYDTDTDTGVDLSEDSEVHVRPAY